MPTDKKKLLADTAAFWGPVYGYSMSEEDASEILFNAQNYLEILSKWDESPSEPQPNEPSAAAEEGGQAK